MSTRTTVFVSLLAWAVFLAFGSGNTQFHSSPVEEQPAGPPKIVPVASSIHFDTEAILQQASQMAKADWLWTRIRERRVQGEMPWTSEATLQRGPNGCCRLEMETRMGFGSTRKSIVISDGRILAKVTPLNAAKPKIESWPLPEEDSIRATVLDRHNCGGPAAILEQLRARGSNWSAQPASVNDRPGLALIANLAPAAADALAPKYARIFLDAESLWVFRAEWWSDVPERGALLYQIEFLNPRVNQPLSLEECQQTFSYQVKS